jgi:hypothetical protein
MAGVPVLAYQQFWTHKRSWLKSECKAIISKYPDASSSMQQLLKVLCDTEFRTTRNGTTVITKDTVD